MEKEKAGKFVVLVSKQDVRKEVSGDMALKTQGRGGGRSLQEEGGGEVGRRGWEGIRVRRRGRESRRGAG